MNDSIAFIGLDTHKKTIAVAIATDGRDGEVRYFGEIANDPVAVDKLARRLSAKYSALRFCYEAGPCGYGLQRQLTALGHDCIVVAPTQIPAFNADPESTRRRSRDAHRKGMQGMAFKPPQMPLGSDEGDLGRKLP